MSVSRIGGILAVLVIVAGCARGPSDPDEQGMRTWVDERGQVQYTPVSGKKDGREDSEDDAGDSAEGEAEEGGTASHPVYNLENFPDAEEASGEDEELYYTWRDAEGRVHNTPYDLSEEKISRISRPQESPKASGARITRKGDPAPPDYNPSAEARKILGLDSAGGRLETFSRNCCSGLARIETDELTADDGVGVRLREDSPVHRFSSGKSRFALIRLPEADSDAMLRVRSFVRDGVFLPSLVFLDRNLEPVRLVTDITFDYSPETWSRYGFMEALIPLESDAGERWLVVFTRESDMETTTTVSGERGNRTRIEHSPTGSLELVLR